MNQSRRNKSNKQRNRQHQGGSGNQAHGNFDVNGNVDGNRADGNTGGEGRNGNQHEARGNSSNPKGRSKWKGKATGKKKNKRRSHKNKNNSGNANVNGESNNQGGNQKNNHGNGNHQSAELEGRARGKRKGKFRGKGRGKSGDGAREKKSRHRNKPENRSNGESAGDPHHDREKAKYGQPVASREFILTTLKNEQAPMDFDALANKLELASDEQQLDALNRRVKAMLRDGQLIENRKQGLVPVDDAALIIGRISAHPDGFGFLIADDSDNKGDVYLGSKQMRQVLHGDKAVVCITGADRRGRREGRIVDVVDRANKSMVGRFSEQKGVFIITSDNKRIQHELMIPEADRGGAEQGDIVVADIVEQPSRRHPPVGKVVEVLGQHMQAGMEIDMALRSHDIPFEWPEAVTSQASGFSSEVINEDKLGRKDITRLPLVTIDGADARDFDDAVYCERTSNGWRLLVAIADVAHYVNPGAPLDLEAENRGTSVYFPGRVVPMLPEVLSNGLCSLNPEVERLCMLCEMTLDSSAVIKRTRFYNAVMRSHARLTYSEVNEILTQPDSKLRDQHDGLVPHLESLHALYKTLLANRKRRGVIEFDSTETRIVFDDKKKISELIPVERNDAHRLIEECMILANVAAAGFLEQHSIPALYRVHHGPKADRLEDLRAFLSLRSLALGGGDSPTALDYAHLSEQIQERVDKTIISTVMLRSMQQAVYQPRNDGHFGLALTQYAHFTSPIRRYPDLLVHRAIKHVLKRESIINYAYSRERMVALGESCSNTERRAEEASRDVVSWLKCEYMQDHIGSEHSGVITAVTSFGLFVELTGIHVEGLVHVTSLSRDYYRFDQPAQAMTGERTGRQYKLGDEIHVRVEAVNLEERKIDFSEVEGSESDKRRSQPTSKMPAQPVSETKEQIDISKASTLSLKKGAKPERKPKAKPVMAVASAAEKSDVKVKVVTRKKVKELGSDTASETSGDINKEEPLASAVDVIEKSAPEETEKTPQDAAVSRENETISTTGKKANSTAKTTAKKKAKTSDKTKAKSTAKKKAKTTAKKSAKATAKSTAKKKAKATAKSTAKKKAKATSKSTAKKKAKATSKSTAKKKAKATAKTSAKKKAKATAKTSAKKKAKATAKTSAKKKAKATAKTSAKKKAKATAKTSAKKKAKVAAKSTKKRSTGKRR